MPLAAWLVSLFGTVLSSFMTWFMARFAYETALRITLTTAFLVTAAAMATALSLSIKTAVMSAQVDLPPFIAGAVMFLPPNLNKVMAIIITIRIAKLLYQWTVSGLSAYLPNNPRTIWTHGAGA